MTMPPDWMPGAVQRPISYRHEAGQFRRTPLGWILHVVVGNGSPFGTFENAPKGSRRFSNFWVAKSGLIEQYAETSCVSWAQQAGNTTYWSVETEGFPNEKLTDAQIASLARIHNFLGAPNSIAHVPGDKGVGTHYMGGAAWGGHTCPDPIPGSGPRSKQRAAVLALANPPAPKPVTPEDELSFLVSLKASSAQYVSNGIYRRWIPAQHYKDLLLQAGLNPHVYEFDTVTGMDAMAGPLAPGTADAPPPAPAKARVR